MPPDDPRPTIEWEITVGRLHLVERRVSRFLREPPSVRTSAAVIVTVTALAVVVGGVLMRLLDHSEYPNIWDGMWWALQTVTTVGYGDVTPSHASGRIVAMFVMLEGIAFLTIIVAAITSTFITRAGREHDVAATGDADEAEVRLNARFDELAARLDRIETMLRD